MLEGIYDMLSSPASPFDEAAASVIVRSHIGQVLEQAADRSRREHPWFEVLAEQWIRTEPCLDATWHPALSYLESQLRTDRGPDTHSLVAAALAMHESGAQGEWRLRTQTACTYRLGQYQIPACHQIGWSSANPERPVICDRRTYAPERLRPLVHVRLAHTVVFDPYSDVDMGGLPYSVAISGCDSARWTQAVALLDESAPCYAQWAQRLLRVVVPLDAPAGHQISASHWHRRGEVLMSSQIRPDQLAEMLIHEASHQHFFMAGMLSQYDDGSDKTLYYSPVVKTRRPLAKILLAYHAFANVVLFFRHCRDHLDGNDRRWLDSESDKVMRELEQLEQPLRGSRALTELGRRLWQPLASQIRGVTV